ncbi:MULTISPECIES: hypothetical protein [Altibacter]|uniref:hypothetical protein n=1 Tax=Altibacter TaxID=1535231 RepID=UPI000551E47B|nr:MULTISPECIES: hypothetical protein [Altibacter]MCW8982388.1 hypothetical protein [Altibacter sp.]MCW9036337.1 hypothetical protein [Altibacter sp.]
MKIKILAIFVLIAIAACTDKKKKDAEVMIPVEADGGIGDGAPSLDSLLQEEAKKDSLLVPDSSNLPNNDN